MTAIHETAYPRIRSNLSDQELKEPYTPTPTDMVFVRSVTKTAVTELGLVILLKTFQRLGYFPSFDGLPPRLINHIAAAMGSSGRTPGRSSARLSATTTWWPIWWCFTYVVVMSRVLQELVDEGYPVTPAVIARLSPYKTEHINRFGHYELRFDQVPPPITEDLRLPPVPEEPVAIC